jgi:hypothetical protein
MKKSNGTHQHDLPVPAGAVDLGPWVLDHGTARSFAGTRRDIPVRHGFVYVDIGGDQWLDGRIERYITVAPAPSMLSGVEARALARMLIAAGDECDWLADADRPVSR